MLDIGLVRGNPEVVRQSLKKRKDSQMLALLEELLRTDSLWRGLKQKTDSLRHARNEISKKINQAKKDKRGAGALIKQAKQIPPKIKENEDKMQELREKIDSALSLLPNILHESVPEGKTDADNIEIKLWGRIASPGFELKHHGSLAVSLDLADFERAVKISGPGFYFLKGELALMDLALQKMAIDDLAKKGFTPLYVPFMMKRKPYEGAAPLGDFENVLYKIEEQDLYLIATSEHPMAAMFMDEILMEEELPIKLCGISSCFRGEIGKHGIDEKGLFRVHQFSKIEQFVFCKPEDSWKFHDELLANSEWVLQKLELPYKVVNVCAGEIGNFAAKKYDVEGYSPREGKFIEVMSCSNCTDYQANRLNIRFRKKNSMEKTPVHTLNNTAIATARIIRLILEYYQTKQGTVKVPKVLQPYMNGLREIVPKK